MTEFPPLVALVLPLTVLLGAVGVGLAVLALVAGVRFPPLAAEFAADLRVDGVLSFARAMRVSLALVLAGFCGTDLLAGDGIGWGQKTAGNTGESGGFSRVATAPCSPQPASIEPDVGSMPPHRHKGLSFHSGPTRSLLNRP